LPKIKPRTNNRFIVDIQYVSSKEGYFNLILKHLIGKFRKLSVKPDKVHIPGRLYKDLIDNVEDIAEGNPEDTKDVD
jgi:hypothetical protein